MKRNIAIIVVIIFILSTVITGCLIGDRENGSNGGEMAIVASAPGPFGAYETPVTITTVRVAFPWLAFPPGDNIENNIWKRAYAEHLNINIEYLWMVPEFGNPFDQRFNLMLATNDLPDIIPLYTTLFMRAVDAEILQCLWEVYERYASPRLREVMEMNDSAALRVATFDGRLLAIAQPIGMPNRPAVTIRDDWMEELGLQAPRTIDDVIMIARAFADAQLAGARTVPIGVSASGTGEIVGSLRPLFNAFGVYPDTWMVENGEFVYGGILPTIQDPLRVLAQLRQENVIVEEFSIKSVQSELSNDIIAGHVGMVFGGIIPSIAIAHRYNGVTWTTYTIYNNDGTPVSSFSDPAIQTFFTVSRYSQHPEALIRLLNFTLETLEGDAEWVEDNSFHTYVDTDGNAFMTFFYPPVVISDPMFNARAFKAVQEALETGDTSAMNPQMLSYYAGVRAHLDTPSREAWAAFQAWGPGGSIGEEIAYAQMGAHLIGQALITEVPAWVRSGQSVASRLDEFIIRAIMGSRTVEEEFQDFVDFFYRQGGENMTREINELNVQYLR